MNEVGILTYEIDKKLDRFMLYRHFNVENGSHRIVPTSASPCRSGKKWLSGHNHDTIREVPQSRSRYIVFLQLIMHRLILLQKAEFIVCGSDIISQTH